MNFRQRGIQHQAHQNRQRHGQNLQIAGGRLPEVRGVAQNLIARNFDRVGNPEAVGNPKAVTRRRGKGIRNGFFVQRLQTRSGGPQRVERDVLRQRGEL